jgi:hypothetical protein
MLFLRLGGGTKPPKVYRAAMLLGTKAMLTEEALHQPTTVKNKPLLLLWLRIAVLVAVTLILAVEHNTSSMYYVHRYYVW